MRAITAYKIKTTDMGNVEMVLSEIKGAIEKVYQKQINTLLAREIERYVDEISIRLIPRPENMTIEQAAVQSLQRKIYLAENQNLANGYNFRVTFNILSYEGSTYLKCNAANMSFEKQVLRIHDLLPVHLTDAPNDQNLELWSSIQEKYADGTTMGISLVSGLGLKFSYDNCTFQSVEERAMRQAQHRLMNELLNEYTGGQQIRPEELMHLIEIVENDIRTSAVVQERLARLTSDVQKILPQITKEMCCPVAEAPAQAVLPANTSEQEQPTEDNSCTCEEEPAPDNGQHEADTDISSNEEVEMPTEEMESCEKTEPEIQKVEPSEAEKDAEKDNQPEQN